jgi:hypothetical protein
MKTERSDIKFPLWRKKVDASLFNKLDSPIPKWLSKLWEIEETFGQNSSKKNKDAEVVLKINNTNYRGWVTYAKYQEKDTDYKLFFTKEFAEKLKDLFIMSYMRTLESKLRRGNKLYTNNIEDDIPFWEFLDLEFDKSTKTFYCKAHYTHKPIFPELFKQFINSHLLKEIENKLLDKGDFKFIKDDWRPKTEINNFLERRNIIYYLLDTTNQLLYIGESEHTKRILQARKEIPHWDYFRVDSLPEWLSKNQRLELERLVIRTFASVLLNSKNIKSMKISSYTLANKKIDI